MLGIEGILFFLALLAVAALLEPVARRLHVPFTIVLVLLGFAGSEITTRFLAIDTGIRWDNFHLIIFNVFIPVIIFSAAIKLDPVALWRNAIQVFFIAVPLMLLSTVICALLLYYGIGHETGFPWVVAILTGVILSSTDPSAAITVFKNAGIPERLHVLLEGESLINDAMAIVLFGLLAGMMMQGGSDVTFLAGLKSFLTVFFGGICAGLVAGGLCRFCIELPVDRYLKTLLTILIVYGAWLVADHLLHVSGVMAVLACGLVVGHFRGGLAVGHRLTVDCWELFDRITGMLVYLLAGVTITIAMFLDQWLAMLIGIAAVLFARGIMFLVCMPGLGLLPGVQKLTMRELGLLGWGGVRGTVTLALALSLPLALPGWYTAQSIAYGVVLFSMLVQVTTLPLLARGIG